jgi:prolyl 4-hydroxylase
MSSKHSKAPRGRFQIRYLIWLLIAVAFGGFVFVVLRLLPSAGRTKRNAFEQKLTTLSENPRIYHYKNFLSDAECDYLIDLGKKKLKPSKVIDYEAKKERLSDYRTSSSTWLSYEDTKTIDERIAKVTHLPPSNFEQTHLVKYSVNEYYKSHEDFFGKKDPETKQSGDRLATFIIFLNTVPKGGETYFPKKDIKVKPIKGDAVLFYNLKPNGKEDYGTTHEGLPVLEGEKYIVNKWIRTKRFVSE